MNSASQPTRLRIDKWLWAARFYKTRSLATDEITKGRISVNGQICKASKEVTVGDVVSIRLPGYTTRTLHIHGISTSRGPAAVAQHLYVETADSLAAQHRAHEQRRMGQEPALSQPHGRPTKRDRREIDAVFHQPPDWNERWTAKLP
jgi:ribosome-associated heat shock protein Hsp15